MKRALLKLMFSPDAGGGDPPAKQDPPKSADPAPKQDPPKQDPPKADPKTEHNGAAEAALSDAKAKLASAEAQKAEAIFEAQTAREAAKAGAKDPDYFEYLAKKERAAKGDKFDMAAFVAGLKTSNPGLFGGAAATTTAGGTPAPGSADAVSIANQKIADAKKRGDVGAVLQAETELAAALAAKK